MMIKIGFFVLVLINIHIDLFFQQKIENDDWEISKNEDRISIYLRTVSYSNYKEFKGEMIVKSSCEDIIAFLQNIESFEKWLPDCKESKRLIKISEYQQINYVVTEVPWPYENRDIVYLFTVADKDPKTGQLKILIENKPGYIPEKSNIVRIPKSLGFWTFTPISENQTKVEYQMHVEPGGFVPAWLANLKIVDTPYAFLYNLRKQIEK